MKRTISYALGGLWLAVFAVAFIQDPVAKPSKKPTRSTKSSALALSSTIDPVCKMSLSSGITDTATYAGKPYGFCSSLCKERFKQRPAAYVR